MEKQKISPARIFLLLAIIISVSAALGFLLAAGKIGKINLPVIITPAPAERDIQNSKFCTGKLEECNNKNISIEGELAKTTIHQHFYPSNILQEYENIIYLDTKEYRQITLLSKEKINCENNIRIYGLLDIERLECGPGIIGKCPAEEYFVYVHGWECLE